MHGARDFQYSPFGDHMLWLDFGGYDDSVLPPPLGDLLALCRTIHWHELRATSLAASYLAPAAAGVAWFMSRLRSARCRCLTLAARAPPGGVFTVLCWVFLDVLGSLCVYTSSAPPLSPRCRRACLWARAAHERCPPSIKFWVLLAAPVIVGTTSFVRSLYYTVSVWVSAELFPSFGFYTSALVAHFQFQFRLALFPSFGFYTSVSVAQFQFQFRLASFPSFGFYTRF